MKISTDYIKTITQTGKEFDSRSHELLIKAGFIDPVASGLYSYLPPGLAVLNKIEDIVRTHMNSLGALEVSLPSLHPKDHWLQTKRWDSFDVLFKVQSRHDKEYGLGPSHEEIVTPLAAKYIQTHKDLPLGLYQIGTKFRDEARAKSGILRGREFRMKDLYSFHADNLDFEEYYKKVIVAYQKIFTELGFEDVKMTEASGGDFTKKFSHEFNVLTEAGEVDLIYCAACDFAQNAEVLTTKLTKCPKCGEEIKEGRAIEIGNIFDLGTRFSDDFKVKFKDEQGRPVSPHMGCYGIGTSRLLGAIVEVNNDKNGIIWPTSVAPFHAHLVNLVRDDSKFADLIYRTLQSEGISVLYDDRSEVSAGEKLVVSDLIGVPIRLLVSDRTGDQVEWKLRIDEKTRMFSVPEVVKHLKDAYVI